MQKRTWLAAICLITLGLGTVAMAQQPATLVLRSGEHVSGELADMGADLLDQCLEDLRKGPLSRVPQDDERATYAPALEKTLELGNAT